MFTLLNKRKNPHPKYKSLGCLVVCLMLVTNFSFAEKQEGTDTSGGGDTRSLQFVAMAKELIKYLEPLEKQGKIDLGKIDYDAFRKAIENTKVSVTNETLYVNGVPKEAKNYPKRKPPEIVLHAERWDAVNEGSRRAAILLHEYLGIMGIDDTKYQISSKIYQDTMLKNFLNNADFASAPDQGQNLPFAIDCELYDNGKLVPGALGLVGDSGTIGNINYSAQMFTARQVKDTSQGKLVVSVDTGTDPLTQLLGSFQSTVKRPLIRISIGYGSQFVGPPKEVIIEQDLRVTPDFDASVSYPKEKIQVRCKRLTRKILIEKDQRLKMEMAAMSCGMDRETISELDAKQIEEILAKIKEKYP